ncbi:MAG: hypothetical protein R3C44_04665 [Chloroflexota bacterium]
MDDYLVSGEKMWDYAGGCSEPLPVFAKTDPDKGAALRLILERGWPGLTTGTIEGKMGVHASNTGWIAAGQVRTPATAWAKKGRGSRLP